MPSACASSTQGTSTRAPPCAVDLTACGPMPQKRAVARAPPSGGLPTELGIGKRGSAPREVSREQESTWTPRKSLPPSRPGFARATSVNRSQWS
jgi:hypothetical protein